MPSGNLNSLTCQRSELRSSKSDERPCPPKKVEMVEEEIQPCSLAFTGMCTHKDTHISNIHTCRCTHTHTYTQKNWSQKEVLFLLLIMIKGRSTMSYKYVSLHELFTNTSDAGGSDRIK